MNAYTKLKLHLARHQYKRGQFKGDAPADSSRRGKNHFRVTKQGDKLCVRMYNTNLIEVTPENTVRISMGGWWTSTTKVNLNEAMWHFLGWGDVGSRRLFNYNQMAIRVKGVDYKFYDGMTFDAEGTLLSPSVAFERKRKDKEATTEFRKDIQDSGFAAVWPVLFAAAEPARHWDMTEQNLLRIVTQEHRANDWPRVAEHFNAHYETHQEALNAIKRVCTQSMNEIVKTDVHRI